MDPVEMIPYVERVFRISQDRRGDIRYFPDVDLFGIKNVCAAFFLFGRDETAHAFAAFGEFGPAADDVTVAPNFAVTARGDQLVHVV